MNAWMYWKQQAAGILLQIMGLCAACLYLGAMKLTWWQILPLFLSYLAILLVYQWFRYWKKRAYFRSMAGLVENLEEKYLFPEIWKGARSYEETAYLCLMRESTKSMLEKVEQTQRETREYQEWLEAFVHDMKQPVSAVKLIMERTRTQDSRAVLFELEKMNHLLDQVLYYGRSESPRPDFMVKEVTISEALDECLAMNKQLLIQNRVRIELPDRIPTVYGDKKGIIFLLNQLVYNAAIYHREEGALIRFSYQRVEERMKLFIWDNGCGIAPEDLPRVFEKGFTGKNGRKNVRSTGMGLYLCKKNAQKLGIGLSIDSAEEKYTEACLDLPLRL